MKNIFFGRDRFLLDSREFRSNLFSVLYNQLPGPKDPDFDIMKDYQSGHNLTFGIESNADNELLWFDEIIKLTTKHPNEFNFSVLTNLPWPALRAVENFLKSKKCSVKTRAFKDLEKEFECDIYIDSDFVRVKSFIGQVKELYLINHDSNLNEILPPQIIRISSWPEFFQKIIAS